ncbi:MAG: nucleoside phosphorylase [Bacteroidota bacterium]
MPYQYPPSELILNPDGSIYHLNLLPQDIGEYIITVGDPGRVEKVSRYFDFIEVRKSKREFVTHTGWLSDKRITVISTGIGPDNIDIVLNELDALVNIDLQNRSDKKTFKSLKVIRLGTSGCLQSDIPVDSVVSSVFGLSFDNMLRFYEWSPSDTEQQLQQDWHTFEAETQLSIPVVPLAVSGSWELLENLAEDHHRGITITAPGFYAPQTRYLRARGIIKADAFDSMENFSSQGVKLTNLEMETAAIYGLSRLLGHQALSCSAILANRANNTFSKRPKKIVEQMIRQVLGRIADL